MKPPSKLSSETLAQPNDIMTIIILAQIVPVPNSTTICIKAKMSYTMSGLNIDQNPITNTHKNKSPSAQDCTYAGV